MWTFLGMGYTREDRAAANADDVDVDLSPYLSFEKCKLAIPTTR